MDAVMPWIGGAILGAYLALLLVVIGQDVRQRRANAINALYWREDQAMAECPHDYPICLDCGAPLQPWQASTFPRISSGTTSVTRWHVEPMTTR